MSIDTIIGIIGIGVGAISVIFSWNAWKAARKASDVAEETQRKIGTVRFSGEIEKLRTQIRDVSRAVRDEKWEYASEKCSDVIATYSEVTSRFDPLPSAVRTMEFSKQRTQFLSIGKTCNALRAGQARSVPKLTSEIDEQIAFLSQVLGRSGKEVEKQIVRHR